MIWQEFEYLIASAPGSCPFNLSDHTSMNKTAMYPRADWLVMSDADALLIVIDDATGLQPTDGDMLFEFTGNRPNFDSWMAANHPNIPYLWADQFVVAFADHGARRSFEDDLGERLLRSAYLQPTG